MALGAALGHPSVTSAPEAGAPAGDRQASDEELAAIERQMKLLGYM